MAKMLNLSASGRKISEGELVVRRVFTAKYAAPTAAPTQQEAADKLLRARAAVRRAVTEGKPATTEFAARVQRQGSGNLNNTLGPAKKQLVGKASRSRLLPNG